MASSHRGAWLVALAGMVATGPLAGCAGMFYGREEVVVVRSETDGGTVRLNGKHPRALPALLHVNRARPEKKLTIVLPADPSAGGGSDADSVAVVVELERRLSGALGLNLFLGGGAPVGIWADHKYGGGWVLVVPDSVALPAGVRIEIDPDPEETPEATFDGRGMGGIAYGVVPDTSGTLARGRVGLDVTLMAVYGRRDSPFMAEGRMTFGATPLKSDGLPLLEIGVRRELAQGVFRPYVAAGPGVVIFTLRDENEPAFGYWGRFGLTTRIDHRFFLEPYVGYASYGGPGLRPSADRLGAGMAFGLLFVR